MSPLDLIILNLYWPPLNSISRHRLHRLQNFISWVFQDCFINELSCVPQHQGFCGYFETGKSKQKLATSGFVLLSGELMKQLILLFGASIEDLNYLEAGKIHSEWPSDPEPKMEHRQIAFHRMLFEPKQETKSNEETKTNSLTILSAPTQSFTQIHEQEICFNC